MAKMTTSIKSTIPAKGMVGTDIGAGKNVLAKVGQLAYPELKQKMQEKVRRKFPSIKLDGE